MVVIGSLTFRIMSLLSELAGPLESGLVARRLMVSAEKVQREIPKLVKRGLLTRLPQARKGYAQYTCNAEQFARYVVGDLPRSIQIQMMEQPDDEISKKLRFLEVLTRGVHSDNPILRNIINDYAQLRRRQAENEVENCGRSRR